MYSRGVLRNDAESVADPSDEVALAKLPISINIRTSEVKFWLWIGVLCS